MKKRLLALMLCFGMLCGCTAPRTATVETPDLSYHTGVWLSYLEVDALCQGDFSANFDRVIQNCRDLSITDLFVHVRPFCDAVYPSVIFPMRPSAAKQKEDILATMITAAHKAGIAFHAWINPYRVAVNTTDLSSLPAESPAAVWSKEAPDNTDLCYANGIYLNPTSERARKLVVDGVKELLDNYAVDGIHFDDYFYPTDSAAFDRNAYKEYCAGCEKPLGLADWRRDGVNRLISAVYTTVKFYDKAKIFSVSPAAAISKNQTTYFADVALWMATGCVDWMIPQLYFGFYYPQEDFCFDHLLADWKALPRDPSVKLMVGLAAYKMNAKGLPDTEEWYLNEEVLPEEAHLCQTDNAVSGHIYYSYTALFGEEETNRRVLKRLMEEEHVKND